MSRFVITGDFHANPFGEFSRSVDSDGMTVNARELVKTAEWIREETFKFVQWYPSRNLPRRSLIINGDLTHVPGVLNSTTLKILAEIESVWKNIPRVYNIGNHDLDNKVGLHNLLLHESIENVSVVLPGVVLNDNGVYIVPFTHSIEDQIKLLRSIPDDSVVVVHTPIIGAFMTPEISDSGGVPKEEFYRFRYTLSSHYHAPQLHTPDGGFTPITRATVGKLERGSILVLGSPAPHSFSDTNPIYGIWCCDTETNILWFVPNTHSPKYIRLDITADGLIEIPPNSYISLKLPDTLAGKVVEMFGSKSNFEINGSKVRVQYEKSGDTKHREQIKMDRADVLGSVWKYVKEKGINLSKDDITQTLSPIISSIGMSDGLSALEPTLLKLELKNFMSWSSSGNVLKFGSGIELVQGLNQDVSSASSNGSGKSSLFESIVWALYDQTFRDVQKDQVVRSGSDLCSVVVEFESMGCAYRVERTRTAKGSGSVSLSKWSDSSWVNISRSTMADTNDAIEHIIGVPFSVFVSLNYFGSRYGSRFTDLNDSDRKEFLGSLIGISKFEEMKGPIKNLLGAAQSEVLGDESAANLLKTQLDSLEESLLSETEFVESKEKDRKSRHKLAKQKHAEVKRTLQEMTPEFHRLSDLIKNRDVELRGFKSKQDSLISERRSLNATKAAYQETHDDLVSQLSKKQKELSDTSNQICKKCGNQLTDDQKSRIRLDLAKDIREINAKVVTAANNLKGVAVQEEELQFKISNLVGPQPDQDFEDIKTRFESISSEYNECLLKVSEYEAEIRSNENPDPDLNRNLEKYRSSKQSKEKQLEEVSNRLKQSEQKKSKLETIYNLFGPQSLISYLMDEILVELNGELASISEQMFGGDYALKLVPSKILKKGTEDNKISVVYTTPAGSYSGSSDGEKRKADIAIFLAVNRLASRIGVGATNMIVADEALDTLDMVAAKQVVSVLSEYDPNKHIFLISHSDLVTPFVTHSMTVERNQGVSNIL